MPRGKYIVLEGGEGVGKTTQAQHLIKELRGLGIDAVYTQEPGSTSFAQELRKLIKHGPARSSKANVLAFNAARAETIIQIGAILELGKWVIAERSYLSTIVYQGHAEGQDIEKTRSVCEYATADLKPDLMVVMHADPAVIEERRSQRSDTDYFEDMNSQFHDKVRAGYLEEAERLKLPVVDAAGTEEEVTTRILTYIEKLVRSHDGTKLVLPSELDEDAVNNYLEALKTIKKQSRIVLEGVKEFLESKDTPDIEIKGRLGHIQKLLTPLGPLNNEFFGNTPSVEGLSQHGSDLTSLTKVSMNMRNELNALAHLIYPGTELSLQEIQRELDSWPYAKKQDLLEKLLSEVSTSIKFLDYSWDILSDFSSAMQLANLSDKSKFTFQRPTPRFGYEIPFIVEEADQADAYEDCFDISYGLYSRLQALGHYQLAQEVVLGGHKIRYMLRINLEDLKKLKELSTDNSLGLFAKQTVVEIFENLKLVHPTITKELLGF